MEQLFMCWQGHPKKDPTAGTFRATISFIRKKKLISLLTRHYRHLIVVLNVGAVIDTSFLRRQPGIDALLMGQAGATGAGTIKVTFSGEGIEDAAVLVEAK